MDQDPFYKTCALFGQHNHSCEGRITMDHAIEYAGKQLQQLWAILPVCSHGHGVDLFQDDATTSKELREWVCLNRATTEELANISKATDYIRRRTYLNGIYGEYKHHLPSPADLITRAKDTNSKKNWYLITPEDSALLEKIGAFNRVVLGVRSLPREDIHSSIESSYLEIKNKLLEENSPHLTELGFDK